MTPRRRAGASFAERAARFPRSRRRDRSPAGGSCCGTRIWGPARRGHGDAPLLSSLLGRVPCPNFCALRSDSPPARSRGWDRRQVLKAGAWAAPVVLLTGGSAGGGGIHHTHRAHRHVQGQAPAEQQRRRVRVQVPHPELGAERQHRRRRAHDHAVGPESGRLHRHRLRRRHHLGARRQRHGDRNPGRAAAANRPRAPSPSASPPTTPARWEE